MGIEHLKHTKKTLDKQIKKLKWQYGLVEVVEDLIENNFSDIVGFKLIDADFTTYDKIAIIYKIGDKHESMIKVYADTTEKVDSVDSLMFDWFSDVEGASTMENLDYRSLVKYMT